MGQIARVRDDAELMLVGKLNKDRPHYAGYSPEEWRWRAVMAGMEGKTFPVLDGIQRGVAGCLYLLLSGDEVFVAGTRTHPIMSRVVAMPTEYIEFVRESAETPAIPIEPRELTGDGAWWKQPEHNLDVVRLVTSWVDGLMAFTPHVS